MLDPRRVLTFRAVVEHASFSRAADALALTQPAVSQQIRALERQAGTKLLHRGRGGPQPTEAGALLLAHADTVASSLRLADAQLAEHTAGEALELRVGAFPSALATLVPATIAALVADDPDREISVTEGSAVDLAAAVADGRLHLALCFQDADVPRREHAGTRREDLFEEPFVVALAPGHRLAGTEAIRLAELATDTWTAPSRDHLIHRACRAAGFEPRFAFLTRDPMAIAALVSAGLCVTLTPRLLAGHLPGVASVPVAGRPPRRTVYALLPAAGAHPVARAALAALAR